MKPFRNCFNCGSLTPGSMLFKGVKKEYCGVCMLDKTKQIGLVEQIDHYGCWKREDGEKNKMGWLDLTTPIYWFCKTCKVLETSKICEKIKWVFNKNNERIGKKVYCYKCNSLLYEEKIKN